MQDTVQTNTESVQCISIANSKICKLTEWAVLASGKN